ncbi:hypothetical protein HCN44_010819 [Aphidius gifuensis]|uniref:Lariat debranching enzyme C-terminal domain-containing protein n=1 Tax=Aphidius gifuensis TaxID=684658 RepID=A0A835CQP4_APHGI|nr:lariat debranching enzyme [Aphidius gifuensis]KAF7991999.1 hypothetical protein HCN44_010819 [Aphidius gifuensis]
MKIAVEGCAHGELEKIYNCLKEIEKNDNIKIDLLICCGDFQSTRNLDDLSTMAVLDKYKDIGTFYKYYSGELIAPVLTIFIGGNHEASNYLQELPYGGWVAPNIYYMGYASVVNVNGLRIAGLSGIYKSGDYLRGHFESPPYTDPTTRSVYHIRNLEVFRLKQLTNDIDIFISHDWPAGITKYGDENSLLKQKPRFLDDIQANKLGSIPSMELLNIHYPKYWFSAHLHCKFAAIVPNTNNKQQVTKFLGLDKCDPNRKFLQIVEIDCHNSNDDDIKFEYDLEWLTILYLTNHLLNVKNQVHYMPGQGGGDQSRWNFKPTEAEKKSVLFKLNNSLKIPNNFVRTAPPFDPALPQKKGQLSFCINKQTTELCDKLGIDDPSALLILLQGGSIDEHSTYQDPQVDESTACKNIESINNQDIIYPQENHDDASINETSFTIDVPVIADEQDNKNESTVEQSNLSNQMEPNAKKFKRRNQSMYTE